MTDIEQQFAGNYINLVNQCRTLQQDLQRMTEAFDNSTQLNNKLHDEIKLKDKMIAKLIYDIQIFPPLKFGTQILKSNSKDEILEEYKKQALSELVAEQNKKAADNASI